jgi:hypothetical protein
VIEVSKSRAEKNEEQWDFPFSSTIFYGHDKSIWKIPVNLELWRHGIRSRTGWRHIKCPEQNSLPLCSYVSAHHFLKSDVTTLRTFSLPRSANENWIFELLKLLFRSFDFRCGFFTTFYVGIDLLFIIFTQLQLLHYS